MAGDSSWQGRKVLNFFNSQLNPFLYGMEFAYHIMRSIRHRNEKLNSFLDRAEMNLKELTRSYEQLMSRRPDQLVEHFFRHQYGNLCASLSRSYGLKHIDLVEEVVQATLLTALQNWKIQGIPDNPEAWVRTVSRNKLIDQLRRNRKQESLPEFDALECTDSPNPNSESPFEDDLLRLVFACCHPSINIESSVAMTLKLIGGFSESEIAAVLFKETEAIKKRIYRTKQGFVHNQISLELPGPKQLQERLAAVHKVLYLIFNEGYGPRVQDLPLRDDLCEEATRLCHLLSKNQEVCSKDSLALLALMLFQASRLEARIDGSGELLLLEDQDRKKWDKFLIRRGLHYLNLSSTNRPSTYHLEAAIAMQHCIANSLESTNWDSISQLYNRLYLKTENPIYRLNHAIAIGYAGDLKQSLSILESLAEERIFQKYAWYDAAVAEMQFRTGEIQKGLESLKLGIEKCGNKAEKNLLERKLQVYSTSREFRHKQATKEKKPKG